MTPEIREIQPDPSLPKVIEAPKDPLLRRQLELKSSEYWRRLNEPAPEDADFSSVQLERCRNQMKLEILEGVLKSKSGRVRTGKLFFRRFTNRFGALAGVVGLPEYMAAWDSSIRVIADYCATGGANVEGGTGLPHEDLQISIPLTPISGEEWARMAGRVSSASVDTQSTPVETTQTTPPLPE